jgi:hypothetical protein
MTTGMMTDMMIGIVIVTMMMAIAIGGTKLSSFSMPRSYPALKKHVPGRDSKSLAPDFSEAASRPFQPSGLLRGSQDQYSYFPCIFPTN